jgi:hypothetical protein
MQPYFTAQYPLLQPPLQFYGSLEERGVFNRVPSKRGLGKMNKKTEPFHSVREIDDDLSFAIHGDGFNVSLMQV